MNAKIRKRKYTWFLNPLNGQTNEAISREVPEINFSRDVVCADGIRRNLWECSYEIIAAFWKSKESLGFEFKIFSQEGRGKIRLAPPFIFRKNKNNMIVKQAITTK